MEERQVAGTGNISYGCKAQKGRTPEANCDVKRTANNNKITTKCSTKVDAGE